MHTFSIFLEHMDWWGLLELLLDVLAVLLCLTVHEFSHGLAAYRLGDPTAKNAGRLSLNPVKHIDVLGLLLMLIAGVGWAKPVPVDPRQFKNPKRGMAVTALAGPCANFLMAFLVSIPISVIYSSEEIINTLVSVLGWDVFYLLFQLLGNLVVLNVSLGIFNLFPIPPLDGAKVVLSVLPEKLYWKILRYEKYVMVVLMLCLWSGLLDTPLEWIINKGLYVIGVLSHCSFWM